MPTKAVILVGGDTRGTRFRPISLSVPKVLFPAGGKPLLEYAVDAVCQPSVQVQEILLIGFYDNSTFDPFIAEMNRAHPEVNIRYLREYKAMGTAGGLYHFRDQILRGRPERLFVINADVCSSFPLVEMATLFDQTKAKAVVLSTKVTKDLSTQFGSLVADDTNKVVHYVEKPFEPVSALVNAGVYLFDSSVFDVIAEGKNRHEAGNEPVESDEWDADKLQIELEVLPQLAEREQLYTFVTSSFWRQVKEPASALVANRHYLDQRLQRAPTELATGPNIKGPVYADASARIDKDAVVGPNVTLAKDVRIGAGARVHDAVLLAKAEVRENAFVVNSILCPSARVGKWARIEGSAVRDDDYSPRIVKEGIQVPRVSILAEDVHVGEEVHLQNSIVLPHKEIKVDVKNEIVM